MGRICSMGVWRRASPRFRRGPIAASLAREVISEPEKPNRINVSRHSVNKRESEGKIYPL